MKGKILSSHVLPYLLAEHKNELDRRAEALSSAQHDVRCSVSVLHLGLRIESNGRGCRMGRDVMRCPSVGKENVAGGGLLVGSRRIDVKAQASSCFYSQRWLSGK